jgi:dephospho-CoA kinase
VVGLTGGLGAGKSTVARMLADRGAVVVDADELAREALEPGTAAFERASELFGDEVLTPEGKIDRRALGALVFADPEKRRTLEEITHPEVFRRLAEVVQAHRDTDDVVVFDAPLIVETGFHESCDVLVVVTAPNDEQVRRVTRARGMSEEAARSRIEAQASPERRESLADVIIRNDGDLEALERDVDALWTDLRRRASGRS